MALSLTELQAVTDAYIESSDNDIYFKGNVLLYKLLGGQTGSKTIPGGKSIDVVLEYAKSNGGTYGNTTSIATAKKEIYNKASFRWAGQYSSLTVDLDDQRQNSGDLAIVNLIQGKIKNAQKTIRSNLGTEIYASAADGNAINGLGDMFNATSSVAYGNIAADDMALWTPNVVTDAKVMSFAFMQEVRRTASIDDNMEGKPNLYVTTEALKDAYENTLQQYARYSDHKLADAGFDNVLFGGMPVVSDNKQTASHVDALNLHYLDVLTHKDYNFSKPTFASPVAQPDLKVAAIKWSGNLICRNRAAHARYTVVTAS